ncbi:MAG TPA: copper resistance protein NlpE [Lysobacter sp.]
MQHHLLRKRALVLACLATVALAGCQPQKAADTAAAPQPAAVEPAATTAPAVATAFDAKAFAGTFSGTLPCASCAGIDTRIELAADGTYRLQETYQDQKDGTTSGDGTWTAEQDGKRIRLDPNSKSDDDRLFEVLSNDEIRQLDREGNAITSDLPYNLKRAAAG